MNVFILHDPGDEVLSEDIKVFQTKEKLYRSIVDQIEGFDNTEAIESANLYFEKGDYEDILDLYEEECDVRLQVYEKVVIR
jgi:hypothetical protein